MTQWTCSKHKVGNPDCKDCWLTLYQNANEFNIRVIGDTISHD